MACPVANSEQMRTDISYKVSTCLLSYNNQPREESDFWYLFLREFSPMVQRKMKYSDN